MSTPNNKQKRIAVVGAGAAGLMAAGSAVAAGASVTVFEHKSKPGRKLLITGKGRCNVTNDCTPADFLGSVVTNPRFLYSAVYALPPASLMELIEAHGTPLKTERGRRVFPVSDRSGDVLSALLRYAQGAEIRYGHVSSLLTENGAVTGLKIGENTLPFDAVILATGGLSYPLTGSDGSGYTLAQQAGHTIVPPVASLVPLESSSPDCAEMQGLSLRNVRIALHAPDGKGVYDDFGEMLFTHFGVSGPTVLGASAHLKAGDISGYILSVDLKPALDDTQLDRRLLSDFAKYANRDFSNALCDLLPQKMIPVIIRRCGIPPHKKVNEITKTERQSLLHLLKHFTIPLSRRRPIEEAIITRGGVNVKEINPKTMESKLLKDLWFAGEIMDVDAYTGGFNLQIAFSTGYLAGKSAAKSSDLSEDRT